MKRADRAFAVYIAALTVVVALFAASAAHADTTPTSSAGTGQYAVAITSVTTLTVPQFAAEARICVEGAAARYTDDSVTTPSASIGIPAPIGCFTYAGPLPAFRIVGSGATLDVGYYR
jgi:hypothetical protein